MATTPSRNGDAMARWRARTGTDGGLMAGGPSFRECPAHGLPPGALPA